MAVALMNNRRSGIKELATFPKLIYPFEMSTCINQFASTNITFWHYWAMGQVYEGALPGSIFDLQSINLAMRNTEVETESR